MMIYCPTCSNLLRPAGKKDHLYCIACEASYYVEKDDEGRMRPIPLLDA